VLLIGLILLLMPTAHANESLSVNVTVNPDSIPINGEATVTINVTGASTTKPLDVALVIDRWILPFYMNPPNETWIMWMGADYIPSHQGFVYNLPHQRVINLSKNEWVKLMEVTIPGRGSILVEIFIITDDKIINPQQYDYMVGIKVVNKSTGNVERGYHLYQDYRIKINSGYYGYGYAVRWENGVWQVGSGWGLPPLNYRIYPYLAARGMLLGPGTYEVYVKPLGKWDVRHIKDGGISVIAWSVDGLMAKHVARNFVDILKNNDRASVVTCPPFPSQAKLLQDLTTDKKVIKSKINSITPTVEFTSIGDGLKVAIDHLNSKGRSDAVKAIVLLTSGSWKCGCNPIDQAKRAKNMGIRIYTIGIYNFRWWYDFWRNEGWLKQIAKITGGKHYRLKIPNMNGGTPYLWNADDDIQRICKEIYKDLVELSNVTAENVQVRFELSDDVEYAGGATVEPEIDGNALVWDIGTLSANETWSVSFKVRPKISTLSGNTTINVNTHNSKVIYKWKDETREVPIDTLSLNVYNNDVNTTPTPSKPEVPEPEVNASLTLKGDGPFVGDTIWIYILNNCSPPSSDGVAVVYADVNRTNSSIGSYNVTINGVEMVSDRVPDPGNFSKIPFVPKSAGEYRIRVCVWNEYNGTKEWACDNIPVRVYIKPVNS